MGAYRLQGDLEGDEAGARHPPAQRDIVGPPKPHSTEALNGCPGSPAPRSPGPETLNTPRPGDPQPPPTPRHPLSFKPRLRAAGALRYVKCKGPAPPLSGPGRAPRLPAVPGRTPPPRPGAAPGRPQAGRRPRRCVGTKPGRRTHRSGMREAPLPTMMAMAATPDPSNATSASAALTPARPRPPARPRLLNGIT